MDENNKTVRLGDGVTNKVKDNINENLSEVLMLLSNTIFNYIKDKIKDIPKEIEKILSSQEAKSSNARITKNGLNMCWLTNWGI